LPVDVTLKRLATDLRVLLRAMGFGMRKGQKLANLHRLAMKTFQRTRVHLAAFGCLPCSRG
jgi:hypothetical protein